MVSIFSQHQYHVTQYYLLQGNINMSGRMAFMMEALCKVAGIRCD